MMTSRVVVDELWDSVISEASDVSVMWFMIWLSDVLLFLRCCSFPPVALHPAVIVLCLSETVCVHWLLWR